MLHMQEYNVIIILNAQWWHYLEKLFLFFCCSTSSSGEELAHHTQTIFDKVLGFVTSAKEVSKGATAHHISAQLQAKLPEVEKTSRNFNQIAKEKLLHCTGRCINKHVDVRQLLSLCMRKIRGDRCYC